MALKNSFLIFLLLNSSIVLAKNYPELLAKQANENIRFISNNGRYTYYQKHSGSLHFSLNYKIIDVLKGPIGTQYTMHATEFRKKIIITQNENFHTILSLRNPEKIFILQFGDVIPREVGLGINPQLQNEDNWLSYFDPYKKIINFEHTSNYALKFSIKLNNKINPYFIPQVVMRDENTVYYTDLGENGNYGLIEYKRNTNKSELVSSLSSPLTKFEINFCKGKLLLAEIGLDSSEEGTKISILPEKIEDFKNRKIIYQSSLNDIGHLNCDFTQEAIYFIKNSGTKNISSYDIYELDLNNEKIQPLTDLKNVTSIVNMDGLILTADKGKYLIIKGENNFKAVDTLKKAPPPVEPVKKEEE